MMQQSQATVAVAAPAAAAARAHEPAGGDAPPKQVAQAMERLGRAGRIIADIRLGADRLLEALFVAASAPPDSAQQHIERNEEVVAKEEVSMHRHFDDLRALGRYSTPPAPTFFHLDLGASCELPWVVVSFGLGNEFPLGWFLKRLDNSHCPIFCRYA